MNNFNEGSLLTQQFSRPVADGKYEGTIVALEEVPERVDVKGQKINAYVAISILLDDGRTFTHNVFAKGLYYATLNVADQLGIDTLILPTAQEVLMNAHVKFSVAREVVDGKRYTNVDYRAWDVTAPATENADASGECPFVVTR